MATETNIEILRLRLGIDPNNATQDAIISQMYSDAESYFLLITKAESVAPKYEFIIREVASRLYVKRGSEGTASESVDGYSVSYMENLFSDFLPILERDFSLNETVERKGRVHFW